MQARLVKKLRSRWSIETAKDLRSIGDQEKMEDAIVRMFRLSYEAYDDWQ